MPMHPKPRAETFSPLFPNVRSCIACSPSGFSDQSLQVGVECRDAAPVLFSGRRMTRHLSMLRSYTAADALTIGNAACGVIAIFLCLDYLATGERRFLWTAFVLLPAALVCDVLDGYVARLDTTRQSRLGADLDSLADVISFGVAPAVLGFTLGLRGGWDMLILTYFVVCGVSRLARFNVTSSALQDATTGKVKYFEGTPIPTSVLLVIILGVAQYLGHVDGRLWFGVVKIGPAELHPLALMFFASGSAMISATLRIPKP